MKQRGRVSTCWPLRLGGVISQLLVYTLVAFQVLSTSIQTAAASPNADVNEYSKLSVGLNNVCDITSSDLVRCWGDNRSGQSEVPADLGTVKQVSTGQSHTCALTTQNTIRCWGIGYPQIPTLQDPAIRIGVGPGYTCAITEQQRLVCWGEIRQVQPLLRVKELSTGENALCVIVINDGAQCWAKDLSMNPYYRVPSEVGAVKSVQVGQYQICAVTISSSVACWGPEFSNYSYHQATHLDIQSNVASVTQNACLVKADGSFDLGPKASKICLLSTQLKLGGRFKEFGTGGSVDPWPDGNGPRDAGFACAKLLTDQTRCWGFSQYGAAESPDFANTSSLPNRQQVLYPNPLGVSVAATATGPEITVDHVYKNGSGRSELEGTLVWSAWDEATNRVLCSKVTQDTCKPKSLSKGKNYVVRVLAENEAGTSLTTYSSRFKNCFDTSDLPISISNTNPRSGSSITISGGLKYLCAQKNPDYSIREKVSGKSWGKWKAVKANSQSVFSLKKSYLIPTRLQIRATQNGTQIASALAEVTVQPGSFVYKVKPASSLNHQGFAQGGTITYSITTGPGYEGTCRIYADNDLAMNFAGTLMGDEHKTGSFKVSSGKGSGKLQMRWSGELTASISCHSNVFPNDDFQSSKNIVLKLNF